MFRTTVTELTNSVKTREFDIVLSTTKMYELLGRYTFKYGPAEIFDDREGIYSYDFVFITDDGTIYRAAVSCCRIKKDEPMFVTKVTTMPVVKSVYVPPVYKKRDPLEARLQKFKDEGVGF